MYEYQSFCLQTQFFLISMILLLRCSSQNVTCLQNSLQLSTKQPLVSVNLLPCQWISTTNCNLEEERHSAAERRKHMRENASCGKARLWNAYFYCSVFSGSM